VQIQDQNLGAPPHLRKPKRSQDQNLEAPPQTPLGTSPQTPFCASRLVVDGIGFLFFSGQNSFKVNKCRQ